PARPSGAVHTSINNLTSPALPELLPAGAGEAFLGNRAIWIEGERALIGLDCLSAVTGFFIRKPEPCPGFGVFVVDIERGIEILDCELALADCNQALPARLIRRFGERIAVYRIVEIRDRLLMKSLALRDQAAGVKSLRVRGVEPDDLVKIGAGL